MKPEELKAIILYLRDKVQLTPDTDSGSVSIEFEPPTLQEMAKAGLHQDGFMRLLNMPWWDEMVTDVIETPEVCEPDEEAPVVLKYAKDVISEYIAKQFPLN